MPPADRLTSSRPPPPSPKALRTHVWSAGRLLLIGVGLSITFGTFFLTGMRVANRAREVRVPNLQGMSLSDANRSLADVGLALKVESRKPDPKVAADHVLAQDPDPGTVLRRQRVIRVRVSDGQKDPPVPSVVGMAERTAELVLAQEKIDIGARAEIRSASYTPGMIIGQDPPAKARTASVTLLVNRADEGVGFVMPDVIGTVASRVVDVLRRRGFRVTVSGEVPYPGIPAGIVVRQTPQAGFQVGAGDTVALEVSR
jgi:eukaryotic-like serine/threonine-protein kinase